MVERLSGMTRNELRSTYLKQNAGLITSSVTQLFPDVGSSRFTFESMYFETDAWRGSHLNGAVFRKCNFVNVDFSGARWSHCRLDDCSIDGITVAPDSLLDDCAMSGDSIALGVLFKHGDEAEDFRTYVLDQCKDILASLGMRFETAAIQRPLIATVAKERRTSIDAFFRIFSRNSGATEDVMRTKLGRRFALFSDQVLPALLECKIINPTNYRGRGNQARYELNYPLDTILRAEDPEAPAPINVRDFWDKMRTQ